MVEFQFLCLILKTTQIIYVLILQFCYYCDSCFDVQRHFQAMVRSYWRNNSEKTAIKQTSTLLNYSLKLHCLMQQNNNRICILYVFPEIMEFKKMKLKTNH